MKIKEIISNILLTFSNDKKGFSARKVTAFVATCMVLIIDWKWILSEQWIYISEILGLHFMFILALLGLTTWQNVKEKTNENGNERSL